jgi:hypothetical protein
MTPGNGGKRGQGIRLRLGRPDTLNKTSIKPVGYGERFVKRRGLFCISSGDTMSFSLREPAGP